MLSLTNALHLEVLHFTYMPPNEPYMTIDVKFLESQDLSGFNDIQCIVHSKNRYLVQL